MMTNIREVMKLDSINWLVTMVGYIGIYASLKMIINRLDAIIRLMREGARHEE